ncbi:MAG: hypothetical protein ACF8NJ_02270 [Phycisphaerales bacterium JB038]
MADCPSHIWYACYGSNLSAERFHTYLRGGPVPGGTDVQLGARDPAFPTGEGTLLTSWELTYGRYSARWGGGAAFLVAPEVNAATPTSAAEAVKRGAMCRLYRLTFEQFVDVWLQENGGDATKDEPAREQLEIALASAIPALGEFSVHSPSEEVLPGGWYRRLLWLGSRDDEWVLTFTTDVETPFVAPSASYLDTIRRGLAAAYPALTATQIEAYVRRRTCGTGKRSAEK